MRHLMTISCAAAIALATAAGAARADATSDLIGRMLSALRSGADCPKSAPTSKALVSMPWCIAAGGWFGAGLAPLPKKKLLVGLTAMLVDGGVVRTELRDAVSLIAVSFGGDADFPTIAIAPIEMKDREAHARAVGAVTMTLKGKAKSAKLAGGGDPIATALSGSTSYPLAQSKSGQGWSWQGASAGELRKIGGLWVVIQPMTTGVYVSVLTDQL
jgi:hypothetical protein